MTFTPELSTLAQSALVGSFEDPALERAYRKDYYRRSLKPVRMAIALALGLFFAFAALDRYILPEVLGRVWFVRFAIVVPFLLAMLLWTFAKNFEPHLLRAPFLSMAVGGLGIIYITAIASTDGAHAYYVGLVLAVLWAHSLSRLPFLHATIVSLALSATYLIVELQLARAPFGQLISSTFFIASANLIGMFASYHQEIAFRRDFLQRELLAQRGRELQQYTERLHETEQRVVDLQQQAPQSIDDLPRWAAQISAEIRRTVGASDVGIWRLVKGELRALSSGDPVAPLVKDLPAVGEFGRDQRGNVVVSLAGLSGEVFGAMTLAAPVSWEGPERRLVAGFARYLGGALEILEMRHDLALAEARREEARRRMRERGVATMQLCPTCGRCYEDGVVSCRVDGTRLVSRLLPLRIQDRYQLLRLLGQGGMGQVFLACDHRLQRDVAIKVLLGDANLDTGFRTQLAHEARAVARIGHPGVVDVFDLGELDDGSAFIVMEYLTGRSLADELVRYGPGAPRQVAQLLRQTAAALAAAHRTGVVHRDLKPQNVYLTSSAEGIEARLLDFGVARVGGADAATVSLGGVLFGTPAYMAPEQVRGAAADARSDLYALAASVFEALTGQRPIRAANSVAATLAAVLNEPPLPVSSILPDAPADLDALFFAALSKEPESRPLDLEAWATTLAALLERVPPSVHGWPEPITTEQVAIRGDAPGVEVGAN